MPVASGARWALVVVFSLAALEKLHTLRSGSAAWHPVLLITDLRRRHAVQLLALSLTADIGEIVLLLGRPALGGVVAFMLVVTYTVAAFPVHGTGGRDGCRCFWRVLNARSRDGMVARNGALGALGLVVATATAQSAEPVVAIWAAAFLVTLTLLSRVDVTGRARRLENAAEARQGEGVRRG